MPDSNIEQLLQSSASSASRLAAAKSRDQASPAAFSDELFRLADAPPSRREVELYSADKNRAQYHPELPAPSVSSTSAEANSDSATDRDDDRQDHTDENSIDVAATLPQQEVPKEVAEPQEAESAVVAPLAQEKNDATESDSAARFGEAEATDAVEKSAAQTEQPTDIAAADSSASGTAAEADAENSIEGAARESAAVVVAVAELPSDDGIVAVNPTQTVESTQNVAGDATSHKGSSEQVPVANGDSHATTNGEVHEVAATSVDESPVPILPGLEGIAAAGPKASRQTTKTGLPESPSVSNKVEQNTDRGRRSERSRSKAALNDAPSRFAGESVVSEPAVSPTVAASPELASAAALDTSPLDSVSRHASQQAEKQLGMFSRAQRGGPGTQIHGSNGPDDVSRVDGERFVGRVTKAFHFAQERGGTLRLRLSPPELGSLQLELTVKEGVLTASLETETPAARRLLLDNLPTLRDRLAEQNFRVEKFDVDVRREGQDGQRSQSDGSPRHQFEQQRELRQSTPTRPRNSKAPSRTAAMPVVASISAAPSATGINLVV